MDSSPVTFVGRKPELKALGQILRLPAPRLIGITGPAGAGKTRLAHQAILENAVLFDEVCFLTLKMLKPAQAAFSAAAASGLLVLDGLDTAANNIGEWINMLPALPAARVLITARQLPSIPGLVRLRLDNLPVPPRGQKHDLACNASVALFLAAVRQNRPGYHPAPAELEEVAETCRRTGGLPADILRCASALHHHQNAV